MTGWTRIGIVISLLRTTLVLGYSIYEYCVFPFDQSIIVEATDAQFQDFKFVYVQQTPNRDLDGGIYRQMLRDAKTEKEKQGVIAMGEVLQQSTGVHWVKLLSFVVLPLGVIWILCLVSVRTLAWITRGFENERK